MPSRIGVITAKTGAAIHDILNILSRRYPIGEVVLIPALVQGENAPDSICDAIGKAEELNLDVLIIGRGGGVAGRPVGLQRRTGGLRHLQLYDSCHLGGWA